MSVTATLLVALLGVPLWWIAVAWCVLAALLGPAIGAFIRYGTEIGSAPGADLTDDHAVRAPSRPVVAAELEGEHASSSQLALPGLAAATG